MSIVKVDRLSHRYHKDWAIRDISFEIERKGVLGLLGSNGAGKSTVMNILCGVLNQTQGDVFIDGIDMREQPEEAKKRLGFLPQNAPLHLELTVEEYLRHCAGLRNVPERDITKAVKEVMERCGVAHFSQRLLRNFSGGYRQRAGIAQAIVHKPKVVVLDEPTNGLDPNQILEMRKLIKQIAKESVVIFSSHILAEVQATCRDIKMIEQGRHGVRRLDGGVQQPYGGRQPAALHGQPAGFGGAERHCRHHASGTVERGEHPAALQGRSGHRQDPHPNEPGAGLGAQGNRHREKLAGPGLRAAVASPIEVSGPMKKILKIAKVELNVLFYSPVAWLLLAVLLVQCSVDLFERLLRIRTTISSGTPSRLAHGPAFEHGTGRAGLNPSWTRFICTCPS